MNHFKRAPHLIQPRWLTGAAWQNGPEWYEPHGPLRRATVRLDMWNEDWEKRGPGGHVPWLQVEMDAHIEGPALVYSFRLTSGADPRATPKVEYRGASEAACRMVLGKQILIHRSAWCWSCQRQRAANERNPARDVWCAEHHPRAVTCSCGVITMDVRDCRGQVWCASCAKPFLPATTAGEAAGDWGFWQGRALMLLKGTTRWEQATMTDRGRVRLSRIQPVGERVRQINTYVVATARVRLVETR